MKHKELNTILKQLATMALVMVLPFMCLSQTKKSSSLTLDIDGLLFFQDNEYDSPLAKGYTLPGFHLTPTLRYSPSKSVNIQAGVYLGHYWGARLYPYGTYLGIPDYDADNASHGLHALPFLRVEMATAGGLKVVLGDIYGAESHRLMMPMYNPDLRYTADPEAGAQILYDNKWLDLDAWVDWRTFIYNNSPYQENFFVGLSSRLKCNDEGRTTHFYFPVQALVEHRGGEIDTITTHSVQTLINAAAGVGAKFNLHHRGLRAFTIEADFLTSQQQAGEAWPFDSGMAVWGHCQLELEHVSFSAGILHARKFVPVLGSPLMSTVSVSNVGSLLHNPTTLWGGFEFKHCYTPGYDLGVKADFYCLMPCDMQEGGITSRHSSAFSFVFGAYMTFNPTFTFKHKKK